jgi:hypothetical protein
VAASGETSGSDDARSDDARRRSAPEGAGLCPRCRHVRVVVSGHGSTFLRCAKQRVDPRFPKYPPQPILACPGFEG